MTLFYVAHVRLGSQKAHAIQLARMADALVEAGVDLTLLVPRLGQRQTIKDVYGLKHEPKVVRLPVLTLWRGSAIGFNLSALTFSAVSLFFLLLKRACGVRPILYTVDLDQFSFWSLRLAGLPYFFEAHGVTGGRLPARFFLKKVRGIITNSRGVRDGFIERFNIDPAVILPAPNGIDPALFNTRVPRAQARAELGIPLRRRLVLYVGRLYDWKEPGILAKAAAALPDVHFYIVGGTREELQRLSGRPLPETLVCVGSEHPARVPLWLAAADVLLVLGTKQNEYSYRHTSPMKLFEYLAADRPIVASATPANTEIVSTENAFLYEPDNAASLVEILQKVFSNEAESTARAHQARRDATHYTWEKRAALVVSFIEEHCAEN